MPEPQIVQEEKAVTGKTVISFKKPTPMWATWVFRVEFVASKAVTMYLTGTSVLPPEKVKEILLITGIIDFTVWFFGRMIGVDKKQFEEDVTI